MSELTKLIEKISKKQSLTELSTLTLDEFRVVVPELPKDLPKLRTLSMIDSQITSLEGLPRYESLYKLDLSDNKISNGWSVLLQCPNVEKLFLGGNKISTVEELTDLKHLSKLRVLSLLNCPICEVEGYEKKVLELLPQVKFVSNVGRQGEEYESSESSNSESEDGSEHEMCLQDLLDDEKMRSCELDDSYEPGEEEEDDSVEDDGEPNSGDEEVKGQTLQDDSKPSPAKMPRIDK